MANVRIQDLTAGPAIVAGAIFEVENPVGTSGKQTFTQLVTYLQGALANFTPTVPGFAPLSGGGTTNFLRADGTWTAPPGGAITVGTTVISGGATGNFLYDNAGVMGERTATQATAALNVFTTALQGLAPSSGGGTTNFLRADGTWAAPPGGAITIGTTVITGGTTGNFLYDNAGVMGERTPTQATAALNLFTNTLQGLAPSSGGGTTNFLRADGTWAAPAGGGGGLPLVGTGLTYTTDTPLLDLSQTWNASGVTFHAIRLNVTSTASAAGSLLMDLQLGGASQFNVAKDGSVTANGTLVNTGTILSTAGSLATQGANIRIDWNGGIYTLGASQDIQLARDGAGILAQRNAANAQTLRVYNTYTDASNYERGVFDWTTNANTLTIGVQKGGTGTFRNAIVQGGNAATQIGINPDQMTFSITAGEILRITNDPGIRLGGPSHILYWSGGATIVNSIGNGQVLALKGYPAVGGTWAFPNWTPTALASGSTNDYNTGTGKHSHFQRIAANAANSTLTGFSIDGASAQVDGQEHMIVNVAASGTLTLSHQDAGSAAANRFLNSTGANIVLSPNQAADIIYDSTATRWLVFKRN